MSAGALVLEEKQAVRSVQGSSTVQAVVVFLHALSFCGIERRWLVVLVETSFHM